MSKIRRNNDGQMRDMSIGTELMFLSMYRCGSDRGINSISKTT